MRAFFKKKPHQIIFLTNFFEFWRLLIGWPSWEWATNQKPPKFKKVRQKGKNMIWRVFFLKIPVEEEEGFDAIIDASELVLDSVVVQGLFFIITASVSSLISSNVSPLELLDFSGVAIGAITSPPPAVL